MDITIGKTGDVIAVDLDKFSESVMEYITRYGLTQILNDAHSVETEKATPDRDTRMANVRALVDKKLAALYTGEIRVSSGRTGDPVKAEAIRLATETIKAAIKAAGKKVSAYEPSEIRAKAEAYLVKRPDLMEKAAQNVAEREELATDVEI